MRYLLLIFFLIFAPQLGAKLLVSPIEAMQHNYGADVEVVKKNILLSKAQASSLEKNAGTKLKSKIFRVFKAMKDDKLLGYGILINKKVRAKNAVVIYFISKDSILDAIEIIAFNEPLEYIPSKTWNKQFSNTPSDKMLRVGRDIPTITGATLSARSITDGSRLAFALYNEVLK